MDELKEYFALRKNIYNHLSKGFYKEPTSEYLDKMRKYSLIFKEISVNYENADLSKGSAVFEKFIDSGKSTDELAREFVLIFLSAGLPEGINSIVPHESVYLSPLGLTMQEQRDEVLEIYYNQSVGRNDDFKEPEDHISAELGFMAFMSGKTSEMQDIGVQQSFLENHLLKWAPKMCDDVYDIGSDYYKALALFTKGFLIVDRQFLEAVVG